MRSMNISLPDPLKDFVDGQIATGRYSSASEYVRELQFRVSRDTAALSWLRNEVNTRGEVTLKSVHKMLHAIVERNVSQPEILRFYCVLRAEALDRDHPAHAFFLERQIETLRRYEQVLGSNDPQPEFTARQLMAVMIGLEEQWLREEKKFDLLKHWDHAVARLLPLK